jgi:hypothetical protein
MISSTSPTLNQVKQAPIVFPTGLMIFQEQINDIKWET